MERDERWQALVEMVQDVIAEHFKVSRDRVSSDANLLDEFKADSLDALQIVMRIEEILQVQISDEDAKRFVTVQDVADYLYHRGVTP